MTQFSTAFIFTVFICQITFAQEKISGVAVVAPSVSTSMKAREIRMKLGWQELPVKKADVVLVVVRSPLFIPLMSTYRSYCRLEDDAENQLNIAGTYYHIYLFRIEDDFSVTQIEHKYYEADY